MGRWLKPLFFALLVRPLALVVLGLNVRRRERLPLHGPAIIAANHNSHLDTLVLMSLFPLSRIRRIRPLAAADYFLRNRALAWFAREVIGIIPVSRRGRRGGGHPFAEAQAALAAGEILLIFPEGSRGEPERLGEFKSGIAHLAEGNPEAPTIPVYLHGLGKALPKGEALLVPFFCDVFIGEPLPWGGDRHVHMAELNRRMAELVDEGGFETWE